MSAPAHLGCATGLSSTHVLQTHVRARYDDFLTDLAELVSIDCGSWNADGVNRAADLCADRLTSLGFTVTRTPARADDGRPLGDIVVARRRGDLPHGRRILLLAHLDTVYDDGTAAARPLRIVDGIAYGPGVTDDKGGLLAGITAAAAISDTGRHPYAELVFLLTPDEEISSDAGRPTIEALAVEADYALCLEAARENGDLVQARKGIADLHLTVSGRAAHSGIEPERGANAALTAAHLITGLQGLNGQWPGVTVNVGVVQAGSRTNVVCAEARLELEVRATTTDEMEAALAAVESLAAHPVVPGTSVTIHRPAAWPPMAPTDEVAGMVAQARQIAAELGFDVTAVATGGAADANLASLHVPVLDGLGPIGGGDHSPAEWLDLTSVVPRTTLLAALITHLGTG
ncbi:M20 family metallopeptidase [Streptacidiphilus jiangxiensis]|uniref:Glutamate carboxypeptidase n=1 Tax=Streptacidiphilus jiangxiensis TaxID=235985 RepID=A0A1H7PL64_STRJI|nr:M20 family metallopeptidase [Streptacidiphilus jiangxiensis]SEL36551.1 glutamate carboxypeptidase [Streptacidiphilus jiangxiensis]